MRAKCKCGLEIDEIHLKNGCNEEGEDYHEISAECECGNNYEINGWGECSEEEAIEYINESNTESTRLVNTTLQKDAPCLLHGDSTMLGN